mmetsp:Transcript_6471/g.18334  ORF Transcript_6471/g.18334 Transcript_6471/m.18334 type:complete len:152 (-) Transcript_6471:124-579(-)|eukprot:CAMPEP_0119119542 /NCGR_PEP_ID=MMETSP1310-20130426/990_1 /TAXON_ID=464262 /ORGANISM="Genus nov. species nov., Strain RCC2339" /LENGTH=151 /DNA_ID=CAMNT_0007108985 /DNA_START=115 /DNA_END=570 /DNA_ORIENTATION=+
MGLTLNLQEEFAYVLAVAVLLYLEQAIVFVIPVAKWRKRTGIQPPTLYPRDSEVKEKKVSDEDLAQYLRAQRVHQNNVEFLSIFFPIFILAGLFHPVHTAVAGLVVFFGRLTYMFGYLQSSGMRVAGGWYHFGELYILYLVGSTAYNIIYG